MCVRNIWLLECLICWIVGWKFCFDLGFTSVFGGPLVVGETFDGLEKTTTIIVENIENKRGMFTGMHTVLVSWFHR